MRHHSYCVSFQWGAEPATTGFQAPAAFTATVPPATDDWGATEAGANREWGASTEQPTAEWGAATNENWS